MQINKNEIINSVKAELDREGYKVADSSGSSVSIWNQVQEAVERDQTQSTRGENKQLVSSKGIIKLAKKTWNWICSLFKKNDSSEVVLPETIDITEYQSLKNENLKNQTGIKIKGQWYDFDENGNVERVYNKKPKLNVNTTPNSYTYILYDENGNVDEIYLYENKGKINSDGSRRCNIYDKDGKLINYYIEENFNPVSNEAGKRNTYNPDGKLTQQTTFSYDKNGKLLSQKDYNYYDSTKVMLISTTFDDNSEFSDFQIKNIYDYCDKFNNLVDEISSNLKTLTADKLKDYLNKINNVYIDFNELENQKDNNLSYFMKIYEFQTGEPFLVALSKVENNGAELANSFINIVKNLPENNNKYVDDILNDMNQHPEDFNKLSVDLQRILIRPENSGENTEITLNGEIDEQTCQQETGNCYLLSAINAIDSKPTGREALKKLWKKLPNGDIEFTCKGNGKTYIITKELLMKSNYLSQGDDDMRIYELAMDMYCRDLAYEDKIDEIGDVDSSGGTLLEVCKAFFGEEYAQNLDIQTLKHSDINENICTFSFSSNSEYKINSSNNDKNTETETFLVKDHEYSIKEIKGDTIYFINPWDNKDLLSMPIKEFLAIDSLSIDKIDLTHFASK